MGTAAKILLGLSVMFIAFGGILVMTFIGTNNQLVAQEEGIIAQYKQNQNTYDNMWKTFKEMAQVPDMYTEDLKKVYDGTMQGRYGKDGSKAIFQMIKEDNPKIDASMYKSIQQAVESGRQSFANNQKTLLDKKRVYEIDLKQFPGNIVASILGFPKIDLSKYDIVTSGETENAFETKKADTIKLRDK